MPAPVLASVLAARLTPSARAWLDAALAQAAERVPLALALAAAARTCGPAPLAPTAAERAAAAQARPGWDLARWSVADAARARLLAAGGAAAAELLPQLIACASADEAVAMREPAMKLTLLIEAVKGSEMVQRIIGLMQRTPLAGILSDPEIAGAFAPLYERHLRSIDVIRKEGRCSNGVVFFDVAGYDIEGYNKFIPYSLFPEATYSVSVSLASFRTKISVGSNPWAPKPPEKNLATICERYGGGGHARVGAISFERDQVEQARLVAKEIVAELRGGV